MKLRNNGVRNILGGVLLCLLVSCDDETNAVGGEVLGEANFNDEVYQSRPIAYSKKLARVQTSAIASSDNSLSSTSNILGFYDDPIYGRSEYGVLSQVQFSTSSGSSAAPDFGKNPVLDSVVLSIPYYSREVSVVSDDQGVVRRTYALDSVYGNTPMDIEVYRSNYFLRDVDPFVSGSALEQQQVYYSDDIENFGASVEDELITTLTNIVPSNEEIILIQPDGSDAGTAPDVVGVVPQIRQKLDVDYFTQVIIEKAGDPVLSNANNFRNYFRGIYFKPKLTAGDGNLFFFNKSQARITLYYTFEDNTDAEKRNTGTVELVFANNSVNGIKSTLNPAISSALENQDTTAGEENLYLKGGDGSYAVLELFGGTVENENGEQESELSFLQRQNWLINEANLIFYVDQDNVTSGDTEPERIYIFDEETGFVLADFLQGNVNPENPLFSITNHLGRLSRGSDGKGEFYKIQITSHLINMLNGNTDNNRLGVAVSQNVNLVRNGKAFVPNSTAEDIVPFGSVLSHEGTILYGNTNTVPESKRLQLEIFYSAAKNN